MKLITVISILVFMFSVNINASEKSSFFFNIEKEKANCGNPSQYDYLVYSACNFDKQIDIVSRAHAQAKKENKSLLVIVGANWCPPCQNLNLLLTKDLKTQESLSANFLAVEVNGDPGDSSGNKSYEDFEKALNSLADGSEVKITGFPTVVLFGESESGTDSASTFYPTEYLDIDVYMAAITEIASKLSDEEQSDYSRLNQAYRNGNNNLFAGSMEPLVGKLLCEKN